MRDDAHAAKVRDAVPELGVGARHEAQIPGHVQLVADPPHDGGGEARMHAAEGDFDGRVHPVHCRGSRGVAWRGVLCMYVVCESID